MIRVNFFERCGRVRESHVILVVVVQAPPFFSKTTTSARVKTGYSQNLFFSAIAPSAAKDTAARVATASASSPDGRMAETGRPSVCAPTRPDFAAASLGKTCSPDVSRDVDDERGGDGTARGTRNGRREAPESTAGGPAAAVATRKNGIARRCRGLAVARARGGGVRGRTTHPFPFSYPSRRGPPPAGGKRARPPGRSGV